MQIIDSGVHSSFYMTDQVRKLDNTTDKVMLSLSNFAAEMEREKVSQRTYDAMFRKAKALHVTGNKVFGDDNVPVYSSETNSDGTQRRQHVVRKISSEQSKVVVRIFELYASGFALARIAKALNDDRIATSTWWQSRMVSDCPSRYSSTRPLPGNGPVEQDAGYSAWRYSKTTETT
jgi:DNA invertase Pin-like site-specific DNA recombinase